LPRDTGSFGQLVLGHLGALPQSDQLSGKKRSALGHWINSVSFHGLKFSRVQIYFSQPLLTRQQELTKKSAKDFPKNL
jgi:hypothetical protein